MNPLQLSLLYTPLPRRHDEDQVKVIEVIFIYIRLLSVKGCHSKGALITIQTQFKG